jgi:hypothetical protein
MKPFNKTLYYTLNWTWGIIMNIIGAIAALVMLCTGHKPHRHAGSIYFEHGKGWGGVDLGCFFICSEGSSESLKNHEYGHSLQNAIWGPLFPFVIAIPSAVRYWLINLKVIKVKNYDDIWFEGQATEWGTKTKPEWD